MSAPTDAVQPRSQPSGAVETLRYYFLPTTSATYKKLQDDNEKTFKGTVTELDVNVATLKVLYKGARARRNATLMRIQAQLPKRAVIAELNSEDEESKKPKKLTEKASLSLNDISALCEDKSEESVKLVMQLCGKKLVDEAWVKPEDILELCDDKLVEEYLSEITKTQKLRKHLTDASDDAKKFKERFETQALAEFTHYRGLREWAERIFPAVDYLSTALIALSTVGAGLVYSTIFGATRGDIGLMSFTFPLFTIGFLIPAVVQLILRWASGLSKEVPFASQAIWKAVIMGFMLFASASVMAAITILNVTIFLLKPGLSSDASDGDGTTDTISEVPGIIAFALSGAVFLLFLICVGFSMIARGPKKILKILMQSHREVEKLEKYQHV